MKWHDLVFSVGAILFVIALIPALWQTSKPPMFTCALTGSILAIFAFNYATLNLTYAAITTGATSVLWFTLLLQQRLKSAKVETTQQGD